MNALSAAAFQAAASLSTPGKTHMIRSPSATLLRSSSHGSNHDEAPFDFGDRPSSLRTLQSPPSSSSRRSFLSFITVATVTTAPLSFTDPTSSLPWQRSLLPPSPSAANAAETIGKDDSCNDASCLGVWDGLLADCPHSKNKLKGGGAGCVSSQDDTPGIFAEPWDYSEVPSYYSSAGEGGDDDAYKGQMDRLILSLETTSRQRGDVVTIAYQEGRYLRAIFADGMSGEESVGEFYFTPDDTTVQFRIGSTSTSPAPTIRRSLANNERAERVRKSLRYLKLPVLRNRKRTFFFAESDDLDGFGPGSAMLGPPEEMSPGELVLDGAMRFGFRATEQDGGNNNNGGRTRRGSDDVDPKLRIDWVEGFPFSK